MKQTSRRTLALRGLWARLSALLCFGLACLSGLSHGAGILTPTQQGFKPLTIQSHHVNVTLENGYAITEVEQVFHNPNPTDLAAEYRFPIPHKAAVGEFTYWIEGKPVTGEVIKKQRARNLYEQERAQGREAALVEQTAKQSFHVSVTPVHAQQTVRIKLTYLQKTDIQTAMGRYVYPVEEGGVDEQANHFWTLSDTVQEAFSFTLTLRSAYPVDKLRLPKHPQATITKLSPQEWTVKIEQTGSPRATKAQNMEIPNDLSEIANTHSASTSTNSTRQSATQLNQDIVVYWRLQQGLPGAVDLVAYKAEGLDTGTFMLTLTPGEDLAPITTGRDWIFILDYSGSMAGKYNSMIEGIRQGLAKLNAQDRFRIILFNNSTQDITRAFEPATPERVNAVLNTLEKQKPNGGTNLYAGMKRGIRQLDSDRSSALILVTDGHANVGVTEREAFLKLLGKTDVRLFTFVMGNSANKPLLERMTTLSNGFALRVSNSDDIVGRLMEATGRLNHEAMHDVSLSIKGAKVFDVTPQSISSLYRGQQLTVFGRYRDAKPTQITLEAKISGKPHQLTTQFDFPTNATDNPELERLWAFAKIDHLQAQMDYLEKDADIEQAITDLAIHYGLVTDYTSLITVREEVFQAEQIDRKNQRRAAQEQKARVQRQQQPVKSTRVDARQPMFSGARASHGGGGSLGGLILLGLLSLYAVRGLQVNRTTLSPSTHAED
jgi:Ca-activated chloride channel family protein